MKKKPHSSANKRTPGQIIADAVLIERWTIEGYTLQEIADKLAQVRDYKLSHVQIHQDQKKIKQRWLEEVKGTIEEHTAKVLKSLERLEQELWKAWRRSQREFESIKRKTGGKNGPSTEYTKEERDGQAAFTAQIMEIQAQRRQILGLDKPTKTALTDISGKEAFQPLVIAGIGAEDLPRGKKDNK